MNVRILTSALHDLARGREFYERQGPGLGEYYTNSLFSEIDSLTIFGGIHRKVYGFHRLLARRFPYAVYYRIEVDNSVVVYRVLDCRQDPEAAQKKLIG